MTRKTHTLIGAAIGIAIFLAVALLPSLMYGGYAGVMLGGALVGTPIHATVLPRALVVSGMVLGVVCVGAVFALAGAAAGTVVSVLTGARAAAGEEAKA